MTAKHEKSITFLPKTKYRTYGSYFINHYKLARKVTHFFTSENNIIAIILIFAVNVNTYYKTGSVQTKS